MLALGQTPSSGAVSSMSGLRESGRLGWRAARQAHREYRSFARLARDCHIAPHHACELARDGEAEAGAAKSLRGRPIGLGELLEQLRLLIRGHADAAIGNGHLDPVAAIADPARSERDLALLGEFAGIA